ncbi:unnamed protein product [Auanema sp. JU1783]|nr:unnamed protein product [Auanema sp. JU1783]
MTGCYSCHEGATLRLKCMSTIDSWISLQCEQETFLIECAPWEPMNELRHNTQVAIFKGLCKTTCAGTTEEVDIHASLNWKAEIETMSEERVSRTDSRNIDWKPMLLTFLLQWKKSILILVILTIVPGAIYLLTASILSGMLIKVTNFIRIIIIGVQKVASLLITLASEPAGPQPAVDI